MTTHPQIITHIDSVHTNLAGHLTCHLRTPLPKGAPRFFLVNGTYPAYRIKQDLFLSTSRPIRLERVYLTELDPACTYKDQQDE